MWCSMAWRRLLLVVLAALLAPGPVAAQLGRGQELREDARAQRQLRAVEGRSLTQPAPAAQDAMEARQQLLRGGVGRLSPAQRRVERRLEALSTPMPAPAPSPSASTPMQPPSDLPASYDEELFLPRDRTADVVQALLDRAVEGIASGRLDQARSDLAFADRQLATLDDAEGGVLRERAAALRQRLTAR
jgi:hypothetical protein